MNPAEKKKLRSLRRKWGFVLLVGWIIAWYKVDGVETALFAVLTFPLPFVGGHYFAKYRIAQTHVAQRQREELNARAAAATDAAEKAQRLASMAQADRLARIKNARKEVIDKLGVVSDYLDLLPGTTDSDRAMLIVQNVKKELRELVAKYPLHDLAALIRGDETIQLKLPLLRDKLAALNIESDEAQVIFEGMRRGLNHPAGNPPLAASGSGPVSAAGESSQTAKAARRHGLF